MVKLPTIYFAEPLQKRPHGFGTWFLIENPLSDQISEWGLDSFENTRHWCRFCRCFMDPDLISKLRPFRLLSALHILGIWGLKEYTSVGPARRVMEPLLNWWSTSFLSKQAILGQLSTNIENTRNLLEPIERYREEELDTVTAREDLNKIDKSLESVEESLLALLKVVDNEEPQLIFNILCLRSVYSLTRTAIRVWRDGRLSRASADPSWCAGLYLDYELELKNNVFKWSDPIYFESSHLFHLTGIKVISPTSLRYLGRIEYKFGKVPEGSEHFEKRMKAFQEKLSRFKVSREHCPLYFFLSSVLAPDHHKNQPNSNAFRDSTSMNNLCRGWYEFRTSEKIPRGLLDDRIYEEGQIYTQLDFLFASTDSCRWEPYKYTGDRHWGTYALRTVTAFFFALAISIFAVDAYAENYCSQFSCRWWTDPYWIITACSSLVLIRPIRQFIGVDAFFSLILSSIALYAALLPALIRLGWIS